MSVELSNGLGIVTRNNIVQKLQQLVVIYKIDLLFRRVPRTFIVTDKCSKLFVLLIRLPVVLHHKNMKELAQN